MNIEKLLSELEILDCETANSAIDTIIFLIEKIEKLNDELDNVRENFEDYKRYGRCYDYENY